MSHVPTPGTIPFRAIEYLKLQPSETQAPTTTELEDILGQPHGTLIPCLTTPRKHGLIVAHKSGAGMPIRWSLPDGDARPPAPDDVEDILPVRQIVNAWPFPDSKPEIPPPEGSKAAPARRKQESGVATPKDGHPLGMRIALWSNGILEVWRTSEDVTLFTADETRQLVHYLERLAVAE